MKATLAHYERPFLRALRAGIHQPPALIRLITGPRQVGKTTAALQLAATWPGPVHYAAADAYLPEDPAWIRSWWDVARRDAGRDGRRPLLILDEAQKVRGWSEAVKACWDEDRRLGWDIAVVVLGSSALLLEHGTNESLAGRFFRHRCLHWTWPECRDAFGWDLDRWLWSGGYPALHAFGDDGDARAYVRDALIETAIARDVLSLEPVTRPALLRQAFALACRYPAQILSYTKMLGQLQDAGNSTTIAHYLDLMERAFLVSPLQPWTRGAVRSRAGSPKLILWNNALITAFETRSFEDARRDTAWWGRIVENAVGAHLLQGAQHDVRWWRDGDDEVDFVLDAPVPLAIEVKSGRRAATSGLAAFQRREPRARTLIVGVGGVSLERWFCEDPASW